MLEVAFNQMNHFFHTLSFLVLFNILARSENFSFSILSFSKTNKKKIQKQTLVSLLINDTQNINQNDIDTPQAITDLSIK